MTGIRLRAAKVVQLAAIAGGIVLLYHVLIRALFFRNIFYEHAGVTITQPEVLEQFGSLDAHDAQQPVVPRIIHQVYHDWSGASAEEIPADWDETRQSCIDLNPDWEYKLWTTKSSRDFIAKEYPWFLQTYEELPFPVQRVDTLRYFLMRHYGGIYIDLDNGCAHNLDPLRYFPAWVTDGGKGALSNNILGAAPNHPFWIYLTETIKEYAWKYPLPYITISYGTGQWFETAVWQKYHQQQLSDAEPVLVRVMMDEDPGAAPWTFFTHTRGGTWDQWDSPWFGWIGQHIPQVIATVVGSVLAVALVLVVVVRGVAYLRTRRRGYTRVDV